MSNAVKDYEAQRDEQYQQAIEAWTPVIHRLINELRDVQVAMVNDSAIRMNGNTDPLVLGISSIGVREAITILEDEFGQPPKPDTAPSVNTPIAWRAKALADRLHIDEYANALPLLEALKAQDEHLGAQRQRHIDYEKNQREKRSLFADVVQALENHGYLGD